MIDMFNNWISTSTDNFNIFIGMQALLTVVSLFTLFYFSKKIGKPDERTNVIYLKVYTIMFATIFMLLAIYMSWGDNLYVKSYLGLFIALTLFSGAITIIYQYRKDFK